MGQYLSKRNHESYKIENPRKRPFPSDPKKGSPLKKRLHSTYDYVYKELFVQGKGSDICIIALKKMWNLHKLYIKQSPFFCAMLEGGWKENDSNKLDLEITDPNVTQESLNNIFGSFYCDYITINEETVISTVAAATWFHMEDIRILCTEFILTNVIKYFDIAEEYNLPELIEVCVHWLARNLLILEDNLNSFDLIRSIPISLMNRVISCPTMVVIQMEQDIFLLLLKWLYLKINPDTQYECKRKLIKDAYKYLTTDHPGFLESPIGEAYAPVFAAVRWEHVITIFKTTNRKLENLVIPKDWLSKAFCRQWMRLLFIHESQTGASRAASNNESNLAEHSFIEGNNHSTNNEATATASYSSVCTVPGPSPNLPAEYFWRYSERCGRKMQSGTNTCSWRWTGFHFGLDLIIKYRRKAFSVVRFWDQNLVDGAVTHTETHNLQIAMKIVSCVPKKHACVSNNDSGSSSSPETQTDDDGNMTSEVVVVVDDSSKRSRRRRASAIYNSKNRRLKNESLAQYQSIETEGIVHLSLVQNVDYELLRLPNDFQFPAIVSANILRYEPVDPFGVRNLAESSNVLDPHRILEETPIDQEQSREPSEDAEDDNTSSTEIE